MGKKLTNIKSEIKPSSHKKITLVIIFGVIVPILAGIGAGVVINKFFLIDTTDISTINETDVKLDNSQKAIKKYNEATNNGATTVTDFSKNFNAEEIFAISFHLFASHTNNHSETIGATNASGINQTIRASTIRNGDNYFEESLSKSSMVGVANRIYLAPDTSVKLYKGEALSTTEGKYKNEYFSYTSEEYTNDFGKVPSKPLIYIVNSKTILANSDKVTKTSTGYTVNVSLNPKTGVYNYMKQMKNISGLSGYPAFEYVHLTLTTDNNLLVKTMKAEEKYSARLGIVGSVCEAVLDITYEVDTGIKIPELNTPLIYNEGK